MSKYPLALVAAVTHRQYSVPRRASTAGAAPRRLPGPRSRPTGRSDPPPEDVHADPLRSPGHPRTCPAVVGASVDADADRACGPRSQAPHATSLSRRAISPDPCGPAAPRPAGSCQRPTTSPAGRSGPRPAQLGSTGPARPPTCSGSAHPPGRAEPCSTQPPTPAWPGPPARPTGPAHRPGPPAWPTGLAHRPGWPTGLAHRPGPAHRPGSPAWPGPPAWPTGLAWLGSARPWCGSGRSASTGRDSAWGDPALARSGVAWLAGSEWPGLALSFRSRPVRPGPGSGRERHGSARCAPARPWPGPSRSGGLDRFSRAARVRPARRG
ncbi:hypothetical protein JOF58_001117 [Streptomyces cinnamonensis]|nr:hypothetical protein [Streptomyces virginiae]